MERKFFISANTADGLVSFFDGIIDAYDLKKLYILKGGSGIGKSTFIKNFAKAFEANSPNNHIDYFYCSGDPASLDGAIITNLGIGIVDGTAPHILDPKYPGVIDEIVNLGEFIDETKIKTKAKLKITIDAINKKKKMLYSQAFASLAEARKVHKELESYYSGCTDFGKVDALLQKILEKHL